MSKSSIKLYDSTLRDGAQTKGVNFSLDDKFKIYKLLSDIGVDYIEGGWPGEQTQLMIISLRKFHINQNLNWLLLE